VHLVCKHDFILLLVSQGRSLLLCCSIIWKWKFGWNSRCDHAITWS
jgi:hypothetical protein